MAGRASPVQQEALSPQRMSAGIAGPGPAEHDGEDVGPLDEHAVRCMLGGAGAALQAPELVEPEIETQPFDARPHAPPTSTVVSGPSAAAARAGEALPLEQRLEPPAPAAEGPVDHVVIAPPLPQACCGGNAVGAPAAGAPALPATPLEIARARLGPDRLPMVRPRRVPVCAMEPRRTSSQPRPQSQPHTGPSTCRCGASSAGPSPRLRRSRMEPATASAAPAAVAGPRCCVAAARCRYGRRTAWVWPTPPCPCRQSRRDQPRHLAAAAATAAAATSTTGATRCAGNWGRRREAQSAPPPLVSEYFFPRQLIHCAVLSHSVATSTY